jgi:hypothetical protein
VSARVISQTNTSQWAKAGVMLRQSSAANAAFYAAFVTPGNGLTVQYRTAAGATAQEAVRLHGTVPVYLKVAHSGSVYTAYTSSDGSTWTAISGSSVTLSLGGAVLAGLAVTSHSVSAVSTATFDHVGVAVAL